MPPIPSLIDLVPHPSAATIPINFSYRELHVALHCFNGANSYQLNQVRRMSAFQPPHVKNVTVWQPSPRARSKDGFPEIGTL
jgi:hypothetical protein